MCEYSPPYNVCTLMKCFLVLSQGMETISSLDPKAFTAYLSDTHNTICGRHPIAVLLNVSAQVTYHL